jgi:hypothetical protein
MARSEIHPSRCPFHAEREDQLFGDPVSGGNVVGAALDLPELYSACRDLTTAAGVNRALAQVFRLLAQRRISRQEAATFGHLAQLLLRTISAMRQENLTSRLESQQVEQPRNGIVERQKGGAITPFLPQKEVAFSPDNKVAAPGDHSWAGSECDHDPVVEREKGVGITPLLAHKKVELSPVNKVVPSEHREPRREANAAPASCAEADDATGTVIATPPSADEREAQFASRTVLRDTPPVSSPVKSVHSCAPPAVAPAASLSSQASQNEDLRDSRVQLTQNEHIRKVVT